MQTLKTTMKIKQIKKNWCKYVFLQRKMHDYYEKFEKLKEKN